MSYLQKLELLFRDSKTVLDSGVRNIQIRGRVWRRLHWAGLALLAHFRRLLVILGVDPMPLLDPLVVGLRAFKYQIHRNVFVVIS